MANRDFFFPQLLETLQPFLAPQPIRPIEANFLPITLKQHRNTSVTKPRMLANKFQHQ